MLLALNGKLQSGKDTTYERIKLRVEGTQRLSFADPLKDSAAALLGITREQLEWMKLKPEVTIRALVPLSGIPEDVRFRTIELTGRQYLQRYGTESHRDVFGQDFWVEQALSQVTDDKLYVITDCRFENEAQAVIDRGGYVVRLFGLDDDVANDHASEQMLPDDLIDFEMDNSVRGDGFEHLDAEIDWMLAIIGVVTS